MSLRDLPRNLQELFYKVRWQVNLDFHEGKNLEDSIEKWMGNFFPNFPEDKIYSKTFFDELKSTNYEELNPNYDVLSFSSNNVSYATSKESFSLSEDSN